MTIEERLFIKRLITPEGCWRFMGATLATGYGVIGINGKSTRVHRVAASLYLGLDLNDRSSFACHKNDICHYKDCFNPDHLYVGNSQSNVMDTVRNGTHGKTKNTHCPNGHELTMVNTYVNEYTRRCVQCRSEQNKRCYIKRKGIPK